MKICVRSRKRPGHESTRAFSSPVGQPSKPALPEQLSIACRNCSAVGGWKTGTPPQGSDWQHQQLRPKPPGGARWTLD